MLRIKIEALLIKIKMVQFLVKPFFRHQRIRLKTRERNHERTRKSFRNEEFVNSAKVCWKEGRRKSCFF